MKGPKSIFLFLVVGVIFLAVFSVCFRSSPNPLPCGGAGRSALPSSPCGGADRSALPVLPTTARNTRVYTVSDASNKVHRAISEDDDIRIVGLVGRSEAIVEANEVGRARLVENPRLTVGDAPLKTLPDVPLRPGELTVVPLRTEDLALIAKTVAEAGGEVIGRCGTLSKPNLRIRGTDETIAALMALAEARWVENYERPHFFNHDSARTMHVNECWPRTAGDDCGATGLGLTGKGQLITTCDTGIDTGNLKTMTEDLRPNVVGFGYTYDERYVSRTDISGHGTHTAGSMVGTGAKSGGTYKGMAYEAKLWAWFGGAAEGGTGSYVPRYIEYAFRPFSERSYVNCGMISYIYSASYASDGSDWRGRYLEDSADIDSYCWDNPDFLPCWAAANAGAYGASTISMQGCAKNALVVGATQGNGMAYFSSLGPTLDGRVKPDICAPGWDVISVRSSQATGTGWGAFNQYYEYMGGTSQATPLTAGTCALLRQWLVEKQGFAKPSSALMKAILMGGATKLKSVAKTAQGEGRVNLRASIAPEDDLGVFVVDWIPIDEGDTVTYFIQTDEPGPFDAELVWVDYPGECTAAQEKPKLVNDLDLRVESVDNGETWLGNGGTKPDRLNNAENIHDAAFPAGRYKLVIEGNNIPRPYAGANSSGAVALYVRGVFDPRGVRTHESVPPKVLFR